MSEPEHFMEVLRQGQSDAQGVHDRATAAALRRVLDEVRAGRDGESAVKATAKKLGVEL